MSIELKKIAAAVLTTGYLGYGMFAGVPALANVAVDTPAPLFTLKNQNGADFNLADRKGKGWTVLFFYPKAHSPGCTTQVCAFRDTIKRIQAKNAELIGVSADDSKTIKEFHDKHQLNFDLVADTESKVIDQYGIKVPMVGIAKRWTFILDPQLVVRSIEPNVDPALDSEWTAEILDELQNPTPAAAAPSK
jgi:thioredoxin-dependent peroxiredoxin